MLGTHEYLYKTKNSDSNLCGLCGDQCEIISHLFVECVKVNDLLNNVKKLVQKTVLYLLD